MEQVTKYIIAEKSEVVDTDTEKSVVGWGSKPLPDRDGELIEASAWDLDNFRKTPVLCLSHDLAKPPIGKIMWIKADPNGLKFKAQFANTERGKEVYQLYKEGMMNAFSVGFRPKKDGYVDNPIDEKYKGMNLKRVFKAVELFEVSCVTVPALPSAVAEYVKSGKIQDPSLKAELEEIIEKSVGEDEEDEKKGIPYTDCGMVKDDITWDAGVEVKTASVDDLMKMCAWFDSTKKKDELAKGDFKLPHHQQSDMKMVPQGCMAAMAALMGARGGVDIPSTDKKAVYNHLSKHYKEMKKDAPILKDYTPEELNVLFPDEVKTEEKEVPQLGIKELAAKMEQLLAKITSLEKDKQEKDVVEEEQKTIDNITKQPSVYDVMSSLNSAFQNKETALPSSAVEVAPPMADRPYVYVVDVYPVTYPDGFAVFRINTYLNGVSTSRTFRQGYTYDAITKKATLIDEAIAVEEAWVEKRYTPERLAEMDEESEMKDLDDDTDNDEKDVDEDDIETKKGRVLSTANRTLIEDCITQMSDCSDTLQNLLDATDDTGAEKSVDDETNEDDIDLEVIKTPTDTHVDDDEIQLDDSEIETKSDEIDIDEKELSDIIAKTMKASLSALNSAVKDKTVEEANKLMGKATL